MPAVRDRCAVVSRLPVTLVFDLKTVDAKALATSGIVVQVFQFRARSQLASVNKEENKKAFEAKN